MTATLYEVPRLSAMLLTIDYSLLGGIFWWSGVANPHKEPQQPLPTQDLGCLFYKKSLERENARVTSHLKLISVLSQLMTKLTPLINHFICPKINVFIWHLRLYLRLSQEAVDNIKSGIWVGGLSDRCILTDYQNVAMFLPSTSLFDSHSLRLTGPLFSGRDRTPSAHSGFWLSNCSRSSRSGNYQPTNQCINIIHAALFCRDTGLTWQSNAGSTCLFWVWKISIFVYIVPPFKLWDCCCNVIMNVDP